jgi:chromosome segregation ATPase
MIVWLWLKGLYRILMRISIPLLLAIVACAVLAVPTAWKLAITSGKLRKSEARVARLDDALSGARIELKTCHGNTDRLTTSLEAQNAAVDALKAESDARTARANVAIRRAQEQSRALQGKIARLERTRPSSDVCASARSLIIDTLGEDRS